MLFSRFFIRVNGVLARVLDTRFVGDGARVLRERTWREGPWAALAGEGAPPCVDFGGVADQVAARRLPLVSKETEALALPPERLERSQ